MRDTLFDFQDNALADLHSAIADAHTMWRENKPQIISFSAPTGAGKTIIMTTLFEELLYGNADITGDPDSIFVWLSDSPELNEQSRLKIEGKSDRIPVRNLVTITSTFSREYLESGCIYFLNTQKLGTDKLLTTKADKRLYTIWETLSNTAVRSPKKLYVIIDEAHRGTKASDSTSEAQKALSIMQKFIKGSPDDGLCVMPLVIGVTATPQRFDSLVSGIPSTVQKVIVPPEQVRESGLLKDRIILHYPDMPINADMTTFEGAVRNWQSKCIHWKDYFDHEGGKEVKPILVIQVEDGNEREVSRSDISACIGVIEEITGNRLNAGEVVHTFNDHGTLSYNGLDVYQVDASRIEEDENIKVVFFKMNLSTGWDCPRAETMMSFRSAQDYTYIAQLLGRMIRTPLARRIASDAELNNVSLFLPYFNEETVKTVVDALRENEAIAPAETVSSSQYVTLHRNAAFADVFDAMRELVTYRIDSVRKQSSLKLLVQLSRALTMDGIDVEAQRRIKNAVLSKIDAEIAEMKSTGSFDEKKVAITGMKMGSLAFDYGDTVYSYDEDTQTMTVSDYDIRRHFDRAGKILGEGLHTEYWIRHSTEDFYDVHVDIIVFVNETSAMERLEEYAAAEFSSLYHVNQRAIAGLHETRRAFYERLINSSSQPVSMPWELPVSIDFTLHTDDELFDNHLFVDDDGSFKTNLNPWEKGVLIEELNNGAVCWLRNLDRKKWSLEIPYEVNGVATPMFPDLLIIRAENGGYVFDILEPHNPSLDDNWKKAVGMAKFAQKHWTAFGRIQLIKKAVGPDGKEHFYRLDMSDHVVRNKVRGITTDTELKRIFDDNAVRCD